MNKTKQFWTLFKFQTAINPFMWFMPLVICAPLLFTGHFSGTYHPDLTSLLTVQNIFFVSIIGMFILAPERFQIAAASVAWSYGTEFLLTRAIDRPVLYRSKATFLYILVLLIPTISLLYSLKNPDLKVTEYSKLTQQLCLSHVPGSSLEPNPSGNRSPLISILRGSVLVEEWHFWQFVVSTLGAQVLLLLLYPFKHRIFAFYALFIGFIFGPLIIDVYCTKASMPSHLERFFFCFAAHQTVFWILTALAVILGQLWCERRFARLEQ